jgi:hypothetical protein
MTDRYGGFFGGNAHMASARFVSSTCDFLLFRSRCVVHSRDFRIQLASIVGIQAGVRAEITPPTPACRGQVAARPMFGGEKLR